MSKIKETKETKEIKETKDAISSQNVLGSFLKTNKEDHYNFEDEVDYKVSSGSLQFDLQLGGGFGPGLHRFVGMNEGGKTSESLEVMKNFCNSLPNAKGFYIKAEGRLSPEMRERSGVRFVFSADEWVNGTCFVFESNIYETVVEVMRELVAKNEQKTKYCFLLDSVDGLITKGDLDKSFEDSNKVAGGAVIAANFMKRLSIALTKRGHMAIFISQVRADIKLDPYSKAPIRQTSATGGNALLHFANYIVEFEPRYKGDLILQDPANKTIDLKKNPIIGHFAKATIKKSPNEKTNMTITYPIRYGRKNGTSIWVQKEIVDLLYAWEFLEKKGAWINPVDEFKELLNENDLEFPEKVHGDANLFKFIEDNEKICDFLIGYFKQSISDLN
jgi:RecA/RadA recombinase